MAKDKNKLTPDDKAEALNEWRRQEFAELGKTLTVLKSIRDGTANPIVIDTCPHCKKPLAKAFKLCMVSAKDKIDASKTIVRMLDAVSPEKVAGSNEDARKKPKKTWDYPELTPEMKARLDSIPIKTHVI